MKISELSHFEWDQKLNESPYAEFFHTSFWISQVCLTMGGNSCLYLCEQDDHNWLVPIYTGSPWSSGFRVGSVGYGGPIPLQEVKDISQEITSIETILSNISLLTNLNCTGLTTYPLLNWNRVKKENCLTCTQIIPLKTDEEIVFNEVLTGNVRTAIRRARQSEVSIKRLMSSADLLEAHKMLNDTQKRVQAGYLTSLPFLSEISKHPAVTVWGAYYKEEMIAMSLLLLHQNKAFHLFHGWKREQIPNGANQLLIWEMVKCAVIKGCKSFNMGESHSPSLRAAKARWGCEEIPILKMSFI